MKDNRANLLLLMNLMREEGSDPSEFHNLRESAREESNTKSFCRAGGILPQMGGEILRSVPSHKTSRRRSEIGLTGEDAITRFGAVGWEGTAVGVENFQAQ